jgi:hypothetical protein
VDDKRWWDIISVACKPGAGEAAWCEGLHRELSKLPVVDILAFDQWFDDRASEAYTHDLIVAKYYATGFGGSDGMYYFRCWLIAQGRTAYYNAIANADSLADLDTSDDAEAEIYAEAQRAWATVTGKSMDEYHLGLPARHNGGRMTGEVWDDDDPAEMKRRLPRIVAKYGDQYE